MAGTLLIGTATNQAPLILQLQASFGSSPVPGETPNLMVTYASAILSTTTGSAARPVLYRPISQGTPTVNQTAEIKSEPTNAGVSLAGYQFASSFSANPSLPTVNTGVGNLPIRTEWHAQGQGTGIWIAYGGALVLYGACSGGATYAGSVGWERL